MCNFTICLSALFNSIANDDSLDTGMSRNGKLLVFSVLLQKKTFIKERKHIIVNQFPGIVWQENTFCVYVPFKC